MLANGTRLRRHQGSQTTLLAALLALVPQQDRIVVVEDSRELAPNYPHVVRIEGRPAKTEVAGAISLTDLVRQSLRMRPDQPTSGGTSEGRCAWSPRPERVDTPRVAALVRLSAVRCWCAGRGHLSAGGSQRYDGDRVGLSASAAAGDSDRREGDGPAVQHGP